MPNYGSINEEEVGVLEEGHDESRHHAQRRSSVFASSVGNMLRRSLVLSGRRCSMKDMQGTTSVPNEIFNLIKNIVVSLHTTDPRKVKSPSHWHVCFSTGMRRFGSTQWSVRTLYNPDKRFCVLLRLVLSCFISPRAAFADNPSAMIPATFYVCLFFIELTHGLFLWLENKFPFSHVCVLLWHRLCSWDPFLVTIFYWLWVFRGVSVSDTRW